MDEQEMIIMNLIVNAGSARSSSIEAIQYAKAGDLDKAEESMQAAKETVNEAHHAQTEMIQAEIRGEKTPLNLLMVHAQDHLMTSLLCLDMAQEFIDIYKKLA
ncbi:MAG: PTS lactose/cellobiose transporter subunit IIA [Erysipelotrichaceae bacterium]|nr:PTS lactose/cellobiose transporter subunit IIA [Erysipelotrichaceae bacterium]